MEPGARPAFSLPSDNQIRLILVTLLGLGVAIYLGVRAGEGDVKFIMGLFLAGIMLTVMGMMGKQAWLLLPLGMSLDVPVPIAVGRDFSSRELVCMALLAYTAVQVGLRRQKVVIFRKAHLWPMLYCGWAAMVFGLNPIGLQSFGSDVAGGRFYFQIFLGFCAFILMANQQLSDQESGRVLAILFAASCVNMLYGIWQWYHGGVAPISGVMGGEDDFYTWHQALTFPSTVALLLILARYPLEDILSFRRLHLWVVIAVAIGLTIFSGKRSAVGMLVAYPLFAAIMRRRYGVGSLMVLGAAAVLAFAVVAHGRWVNLPLRAQRALSWLPGNWDMRVADLGTKDEFRSQMRQVALEEIERHPWVGPGFAINISDYYADFAAYGGRITAATAGHSWHSQWLGIAADFGIPAAIIYAGLMISFTALAFRAARELPEGGWRKTLAAYIFLKICASWAGSWTGGHAALGAFHDWWFWGLLIPLASGLRAKGAPSPATVSPSPGRALS